MKIKMKNDCSSGMYVDIPPLNSSRPPLKLRGGEGGVMYEGGKKGVMSFVRNDPLSKQRRQELRHNQTDAEKVVCSKIRNRQFHGLKFFRQYSVGPYILDFYCPSVKFAVELDGGQHNERNGRDYDVARTEYLKAGGISLLRFWNHEVLCDMQTVLSKLESEIIHHHLPQNHNAPSPPLILRGGAENERVVKGEVSHKSC